MSNHNRWIDLDPQGLRKNSSLAKVISEMAQNALDTDATDITIDITPDGRGLGRLVVTDNDPTGYVKLSDAFTMLAPSTKAGDDTKRGMFNVGEKEFLAFCTEGQITTTTGSVVFCADGKRSRSRKQTDVGSRHDFTMKMTRQDQEAMIARLREIILDGTQTVTVNGIALVPRPAVMETVHSLPLYLASEDDPYSFVTRKRMTKITLHMPAAGGPMLHVIGMPVQSIDCPWSVNVHGRLKLDQARDQVAAPTVATIMAAVANVLAEADKLTTEDAQGWAGHTLGKHSTPEAAQAIWTGKFGADALVASPTNRGANADAASMGRTIVHGGSLDSEAWDAVKRARSADPGFALPTTSEFGDPTSGLLSDPIPEALWPSEAQRVVVWTRQAFAVCFPNEKLSVVIYGGKNAPGSVAAAGDWELSFNQGNVGWDWFDAENDESIIDTVIHEFGHLQATGAEHTFAWSIACIRIAAKLMLWGVRP